MQKDFGVIRKLGALLRSGMAVALTAPGLLMLAAVSVAAEEVHELQSDVKFRSQGQNIWKPTEKDNFFSDGGAFDRVEETLFKVNVVDIQTPEIGDPDYQGLDALNTYSFQYDGATRVKDVDLACDDEAGEYLWLDGCYTCPNGGALDLFASTTKGAPTCIAFDDADTVATPSVDGCAAGYDRDLLRNTCFEICDAGYSYNSGTRQCEENLVAPEIKAKTCASGDLYLGKCLSCPADYSLNGLGICTRATSKTTMGYCGKRTLNECKTKIGPVCFSGWDYDLDDCNDTRIRRSNKYYDCPGGYKHNALIPYNNTGICYKTYADKTASDEGSPSCPAGSISTVLGCVACPSSAPYNRETGNCGGRTYAATYEDPQTWGCSSGTLDLDAGGSFGQCLSCPTGYDYNSKLGRDNCKQLDGADFAGIPSPDLSCPKGTFYDFVDGSAGCFSCPDQMDRTLLPIDSPAACFGLAEGGSGGDGTVELGIQIDAEFALRFAVSGEVILDGGSVDIDLDAQPRVTITRQGETDHYAVSTRLNEAASQLDMRSTWPTMDGYIDTHTESYSYLATKFGVVGFDETTGLPTNDVFTEVLIDSRTGDPADPEAERYYGRADVATDRRHLYHAHVGYDPASGTYDRYTRWILPELFDIALPFDFDLDFDLDLSFGLPDFLQEVTSSFSVPAKPGIKPTIKCPSPCVSYVIAEGWVNETNLNIPPDPGFVGHFSETVNRSVRGDGLSIRQELGRNPLEPMSGFDVPLPQTVDFTRIDLDLDGIASKLTFPSTPLGIEVTFKKLGKELLVLDGSQIDIDAALLISAEKNLQFEPNMDVVMSFSQDVEITDDHGSYTADMVQMPVGESFSFRRLDSSELEINVSYTLARNVFTNDTNLNALPFVEGEIFSLGWDFVVPTPGLPDKWKLLSVPFYPAEPWRILDVDEVGDDGVSGEARFTLGGFEDQPGGSLTLPALNTPPVAVCQDASITLDNTGELALTAELIDGGSSDADSGDELSYAVSPSGVSCADFGMTGVALTVTDTAGASDTCVATVDVEAGEVTLVVAQPQPVEATSPTGTEVDLAVSIGGGCGALSVQQIPDLEVYPLGDTLVDVVATDDAGRSQSVAVTVTVQDTTPPAFVDLLLKTVTAEATAERTAVALIEPIASDMFGVERLTNDAPGEGYLPGITTVVWTATDTNGNRSTAEQNVEVVDTTPPILTLPADVTVEATGQFTTVDPGMAVADDLFEVTVQNDILLSYPEGFPLGVSEVTWSATDEFGNSSTGVQRVTVVDTTAPQITAPPNLVVEANGLRTVIESPGAASATDIFPTTVTHDAPANYPIGVTTVTWVARDTSGNEASVQQEIIVEDTTPPVLRLPASRLVEATGLLTPVSLDAASAIDIFPVSVTSNAPKQFLLGATTVIWRAVDANGNVSEGTQVVLVQDTTAPELSVPDSIVMEGNQRGGAEVVIDEASAQDGVDDNPVVSCDAESGNFPVGETVVNCQATDFAGNRSMETFTVTVVDTTAPELTASSSTTLLSPPNHKYVDIDMTIEATDIVDEALMLTATAVSSESDNGDDDGNTTGDILVTTAAGGEVVSSIFEPVVSFLPRSDSLRLRAERNGEGTGRTYTIVITAADAAGNTAESTIEISVPVGQSGNGKNGNKKHDKKKDEKKGKGAGK